MVAFVIWQTIIFLPYFFSMAALWPLYFCRVVSIFFLSSLWSPYGIGQTIIFLPCDFYVLSSIFFLA